MGRSLFDSALYHGPARTLLRPVSCWYLPSSLCVSKRCSLTVEKFWRVRRICAFRSFVGVLMVYVTLCAGDYLDELRKFLWCSRGTGRSRGSGNFISNFDGFKTRRQYKFKETGCDLNELTRVLHHFLHSSELLSSERSKCC